MGTTLDKIAATEVAGPEPAASTLSRGLQNHSPHVAPEQAWRELRGRFRVLWILLSSSLPGTFLLAFLLSGPIQPSASLTVIGLLWMAAIAWAGSRVASFACPRCGRAFFENWYFLKMLRDRCAHCELPRYAKDVAQG